MKNSGIVKNLPEPKKIDKRIKYELSTSTKSSQQMEGIEKVFYRVDYQYCVIFDASSGRVTESGYFPFDVNKLHSELIKKY